MPTLTKEFLDLVNQLRDSLLVHTTYEARSRRLSLFFERWDGTSMSAHFDGVLHASISSTNESLESGPVVLRAKAEVVSGGNKDILRDLAYLWRDSSGDALSFADVPLVYFQIDGDTCLAIVCTSCEVGGRAGGTLDRNGQKRNE